MSESEWKIDELIDEIDRIVKARVKRLIQRYERIVQDMIRLPKTGRIYGGEQTVNFVAFDEKTQAHRVVEYTVNKGKSLTAKSKKNRYGVHQASAPGEAPARDTAALAKGIGAVVTEQGDTILAEIGVSVESGRGAPVSSSGRSIAEMLEFGTIHMEPRPLWRPALEQLKAEADQIIGGKKNDAGD